MDIDALDNLHHRRNAAAYVRMSTDQQDQSIDQQLESIWRYAADRGFDVVRIYRDEGISGLTAKNRPGLQRLVADVTQGGAGFEALLVCDVSRWGRFQDIDESAYYEFLCRRAGVSVLYCAEQFAMMESPLGHLMKDVKRLMAAEHSRQLSEKIFNAHAHLLRHGYKPGGIAGYGLVRVCMRADGSVRRILEKGERKSHPTDRVVFGEGKREEVEVVRQIFKWYLAEHLSYRALARRLNAAGIPSSGAGPWQDRHVRAILTNPKYCGTLVYNRTSGKLGANRRKNGEQAWLRRDSAHSPLVSADDFERARACYRLQHGLAADAVLEGLRKVYACHGRLTYRLLETVPGMPHAAMIKRMFGSLYQAYERALASCSPSFGTQGQARSALRQQQLLKDVRNCVARAGHVVSATTRRTVLRLDEQFLLRLCVLQCKRKSGCQGWLVPATSARSDFVLAALIEPVNDRIGAYVLLDVRSERVANKWMPLRTPIGWSVLTSSSIEGLFGLEPRDTSEDLRPEATF